MTDRERGATMRDVSHTPPHDDAATGRRLFGRGVTVAADGGERGAADAPAGPHGDRRTEASPADRDGEAADGPVRRRPTMAEVDHTPPDGDGAARVWERGLPKPGVHVAGEP